MRVWGWGRLTHRQFIGEHDRWVHLGEVVCVPVTVTCGAQGKEVQRSFLARIPMGFWGHVHLFAWLLL